ncbi:MAG: hypothetical protein KJ063_11665 [Anaerolineae bacterium]|nr:hypothetical protein [Anaerolineae bacterium]
MPSLRPITIDKSNPFLGEGCALCKNPFAPGDEIVICPEDATRHHVQCWQSNNNRCTALGCTGQGLVIAIPARPHRPAPSTPQVITANGASKVRTLPTRSFHLAQSCLLLSIAVSILIFAFSCFGLWAIADYIMMEIFHWQYRPLFDSLLPLLPLVF